MFILNIEIKVEIKIKIGLTLRFYFTNFMKSILQVELRSTTPAQGAAPGCLVGIAKVSTWSKIDLIRLAGRL